MTTTPTATPTTTQTTEPVLTARPVRPRRALLRWPVSFVGFPLGGLVASLVVGPVDGPTAALVGGLLTGGILGASQSWALSWSPRRAVGWAIASALGLGLGLLVGAALVGYATGVGALAAQGAVCGVAVGLAQAAVLRSRLGTVVLLWPLHLGLAWSAGWVVTTAVGVRVEDHFTVFGSSGALLVALATVVLPVALSRRSAASAP